MARLLNSPFGKASGKIGNFIIRNRNGKSFLCSRPVKFTPGSDIDSINRRKKFALVASFAKSVTSIPSLKSTWKSAFPNSAPFNSIIKNIFPNFSPSEPNENLSLTPEIGFTAGKFKTSLSLSEISHSLYLNKDTPFLSEIKSLRIHSVIFLNEPLDTCLKESINLSISSNSIPVSISKNLKIHTPFLNIEKQYISSYQNVFVYSVIILLDKNAAHISNSQTLFLFSKLSTTPIPATALSPFQIFSQKFFHSK
ncbi:MAG: hypothetical protein NTY74_05755 [Ignavibacteriae bacterium]|nr:hypothetical protein [Ignavibacteriota bacterium]